MTGQSLLDLMELVNQELQLQPGESDVARGLLALNAAQDYFESIAARFPDLLGDSTGTVVTVNNTESTAFPSGLLRIDRMQFIEPTTNAPAWDLRNLNRTGSHSFHRFWPWSVIATPSQGQPRAYWTDGRNIYWRPRPGGAYTLRWYGFQAAADVSASGTFLYPDICALPFSSFAAKLMKVGVGDAVADLSDLAESTFVPVVQTMGNFNRDGGVMLEYRYIHDA